MLEELENNEIGEYIENVKRISVGAFVHLRGDYNSVFNGDLVIKNCVMGKDLNALVNGTWRSFYNGLPNYVCTSVTVDGLTAESGECYVYEIWCATP